jgi:putative ABC transport system ATP-binding protein
MSESPGSPALEAVGLSKVYGSGPSTVRALDNVSLRVESGHMICIMGKSGSGKSTLMRQLGLLDEPTSGTIRIEDVDVGELSESQRAGLRLDRLGYVFQEYALLPELTAEENVYLPALMQGVRRAGCRARAAELLAVVGLSGRARHRPRELSGGEQQRVAIARALVNRPNILFADEPTGNLDTASTRTVMEAISTLNRDLGVTVVFVSHDPDHRVYASDVVVLQDGRIMDSSS